MIKWDEICYIIKQHINNGSKEVFFQNEIVNIFEKLGWSRYRNEIETEKRIDIGASKRLIPDIILRSDNNKLIVIELKRPTIQGKERHSIQVQSYMRQLRVNFGLFIGEKIHFYYDVPNDKEDAIKLIEIDYLEDSIEGSILIELLKRDSFDEEKLIEYCNEKLQVIEENKIKKKLITFLTSFEGKEKIIELITKDLKEKYNNTIVNDIINQISISVYSNIIIQNDKHIIEKEDNNKSTINNINYEKMPILLVPSNSNEFKKLFLEMGYATLSYYYNDGRVENKIWNRGKFNESSNLMGNLTSRPESRKNKWKELGITKLVVSLKS